MSESSEDQTKEQRQPTQAELDEARRQGAEYRARLESMSYQEMIGAILGRAQMIEEAMRILIFGASDQFGHPSEVTGTFGHLLTQFRKLYPDEGLLHQWLETARDARNHAAHEGILSVIMVKEILADHDPDAVDAFQRRGYRKGIEGMDMTLNMIIAFSREHPVEFEEWPPEEDG